MSKILKIYIRASLIALAIFIFYNWLHDIFSGEEGRVRKFILQGKKAVEAKDLLACADMISFDYQDKYDNDRQRLIFAAREFFGYYKDIVVHIEKMEIKLDDSKTQASVEIVALVVGRTKENKSEKILEGLEGEKSRVGVKLVKVDKRWRLLELEFYESLRITGQEVG